MLTTSLQLIGMLMLIVIVCLILALLILVTFALIKPLGSLVRKGDFPAEPEMTNRSD